MVASRLSTSSSLTPPTLVPGQQNSTAGYTFGPGGQATPMYPAGSTSSFQGSNSTGSSPSPSLQGLARPVTAGAMSTQGQFVRQGMVGGVTPPQLVGRSAMPQGVAPPSQSLGRPLMPNQTIHPQTPGRPLTAPPGMSRPAPGGTGSGPT